MVRLWKDIDALHDSGQEKFHFLDHETSKYVKEHLCPPHHELGSNHLDASNFTAARIIPCASKLKRKSVALQCQAVGLKPTVYLQNVFRAWPAQKRKSFKTLCIVEGFVNHNNKKIGQICRVWMQFMDWKLTRYSLLHYFRRLRATVHDFTTEFVSIQYLGREPRVNALHGFVVCINLRYFWKYAITARSTGIMQSVRSSNRGSASYCAQHHIWRPFTYCALSGSGEKCSLMNLCEFVKFFVNHIWIFGYQSPKSFIV